MAGRRQRPSHTARTFLCLSCTLHMTPARLCCVCKRAGMQTASRRRHKAWVGGWGRGGGHPVTGICALARALHQPPPACTVRACEQSGLSSSAQVEMGDEMGAFKRRTHLIACAPSLCLQNVARTSFSPPSLAVVVATHSSTTAPAATPSAHSGARLCCLLASSAWVCGVGARPLARWATGPAADGRDGPRPGGLEARAPSQRRELPSFHRGPPRCIVCAGCRPSRCSCCPCSPAWLPPRVSEGRRGSRECDRSSARLLGGWTGGGASWVGGARQLRPPPPLVPPAVADLAVSAADGVVLYNITGSGAQN